MIRMMTRTTTILAIILAACMVVPVVSAAAEFRTGQAATYLKNEALNDDIYLLGGGITSNGSVRGDLFTFGGNVLINGKVLGDVTAGGGTVSILSDVHDDVRASGGTVVVQGAVVGDVLLAGGQVTLGGARIGGDVAVAGGVVRIDVPDIEGDVRLVGGWTFYLIDGKPAYTYNWVGLESYTVSAAQKVPEGSHTLKFAFDYEGGRGAGGVGTIFLDGVKIGEGKIAKTNANTFGIDESADVGTDENTPVFPAYHKKEKFTGKIRQVTVETFPAK
jgi:hypothetical protein